MTRGAAFGPLVAAQVAAVDAELILQKTADHLGWERADVAPGPWLVEVVTDVVQGIADGHVRACPHISPRRPAAAWLVLAERDKLSCLACVEKILRAMQNTFEDHRCDRCGHPADTLEVFTVAVGAILVNGGVCHDCRNLVHGRWPR